MGGMGCRHTQHRDRGWSGTANARIECSAGDEHTQLDATRQTNPGRIAAIYRMALGSLWERAHDGFRGHQLSEVVTPHLRR
jgi:hypothetical protein